MPKEYICISTEPDSLLDAEGNPYEVFGDSFVASEGEKPVCVNTANDGKDVYCDTTNNGFSAQIYIGETQILANSHSAGGEATGSVTIQSGQFSQCWLLIVPDGVPTATQGFIFEPEELDDPTIVGYRIVSSHNGSQLKFDLVRRTGA